MTFDELIRQLAPRFTRLKLPQDGIEILGLAGAALQKMADHLDFDSLTAYSAGLVVTRDGIESYRLPETFGRLLTPKREAESSLWLWDGTRERDLAYEEPLRFHRMKPTTTGQPSTLTIQDGALWLKPTPDSNNGADYLVRGNFIRALGFPREDDRIPLDTPDVLVAEVLAQAALDAGIPQAAAFKQEAIRAMSVAMGTQAKQRVFLFRPKDRVGSR